MPPGPFVPGVQAAVVVVEVDMALEPSSWLSAVNIHDFIALKICKDKPLYLPTMCMNH